MKRGASVVLICSALLGGLAAEAQAREILGQNRLPQEYCIEDRSYVQQSVAAGGPSYVASSYGVITAWSTPAPVEAGHTLQLLVLSRRDGPGGVGHFHTVKQKDAVRTLQAFTFNSFLDTRIPIEAGEEIGIYVPPGQPLVMGVPVGVCFLATGLLTDQWRSHAGDPPVGTEFDYNNSGTSYRLNVSAIVEPDADRDGFGDETQDKCPQSALTQSDCRCAGRDPTVLGDQGNNQINATPGRDVIVGFAGNDVIRGLRGGDYACGNEGNDRVLGGPGPDYLFGNQGRDRISGGKGRDVLLGGPAKDRLRGGPGKDAVEQKGKY